MNVDTQTIDLTGVRFTAGITFNFADNTLILPGDRLVIIKNQAAFEARYGTLIPIATDVLGSNEYAGRLSNGGEQLTLLDATDTSIRDFVYDDNLPWPYTDGSGFTMVLKTPALPIPDHGTATNWVASNMEGGNPGGVDTFGFTGVFDADDDGDCYHGLIEYALGSSDNSPGDAHALINVSHQPFAVAGITMDYLTISYQRNLYSQNIITLTPEISTDFVHWDGTPDVVFVSEVVNGSGASIVTYRSADPVSAKDRAFIRLKVTQ